MSEQENAGAYGSGSGPAIRTCELLEERNQRLMVTYARLRRYEDLLGSKDAMISDLQSLVDQLQRDKQKP